MLEWDDHLDARSCRLASQLQWSWAATEYVVYEVLRTLNRDAQKRKEGKDQTNFFDDYLLFFLLHVRSYYPRVVICSNLYMKAINY